VAVPSKFISGIKILIKVLCEWKFKVTESLFQQVYPLFSCKFFFNDARRAPRKHVLDGTFFEKSFGQ